MRHRGHGIQNDIETPLPFVPVEGCSVVVIAIGSNQEMDINIPAALKLLNALEGLIIQSTSTIMATEAIGPNGLPSNQPCFHNLALWAYTTFTRAELAVHLRRMESTLGRRRSSDKFAARPIDLDIAIFCSMSNAEVEVVVAEDVHQAYHVAAPIAEILPSWVHPDEGKSIAAIARRLAASH